MKPVMPYHVNPGGSYWAAWGSKGWSAVTVNTVRRKWAKVNRVDARTGAVKKRGSKVRADEMVKRDPALNGADKPTLGPAEVFADVRQHREAAEAKQLHLTKNSSIDEALPMPPNLSPSELAARNARIAEAAALRWENVEAAFGEEIVTSWPTDEDW